MQITSQDVADSLGLSVGRYEYVERQQDISINSSATETSPAASTAGPSRSVPSEVETASTLLPDSRHGDKDRIDTALCDANNTLWQEGVDTDADKLMPADGMGDHPEGDIGSDGGDCSAVDAQTDVVVMSNKNEIAESEHQPVVDA